MIESPVGLLKLVAGDTGLVAIRGRRTIPVGSASARWSTIPTTIFSSRPSGSSAPISLAG